MKKFKIKKCMTSFLMLAVMVVSIIGLIPKTDAFAQVEYSGQITRSAHFNRSYSYKDSNGNDTKVTYNLGTVDNNYLYLIEFAYNDYSDYVFASYGDFSGSVTYESGNDSSSRSISSVMVKCSKYGRIYITSPFTDIPSSFPHLKYKMAELNKLNDSGKLDLCGGENMYTHFCAKVCYYKGRYSGDAETVIECGEGIPDGSADKPYKTDELGTLVDMEKHYKSYVEMGNSDTGSIVNERTHHWGWNKKTSTGLNLLDNDSFDSIETYCYIKFYDVYKKNWITGSKEKLSTDKFKKLYFISKCDASKLKLEVKQTDVLNDEMIKELKSIGDSLGAYDLTHEMVYSYDFYFQLVGCKNGKYYKGGYVHFKKDGSAEEITGGKYDVTANTADEDENGDIKDNDDSETGTGATGTGDNYDDAKNNADAVKNKTDDSSSGLDIASIKSFMKEVGNVPKAIGKLFSFLPDWVTTFIGFGFVVLIALMIIKAIRG